MPTIKKISDGYRFFFYSFDCYEPVHIHVEKDDMNCKFWLDPISLAANYGFNAKELNKIKKIITEHHHIIIEAWDEHCG